MKQVKEFDQDVAYSILDWVEGDQLDSSELENISYFYRSLGIKHDASRLYHRGLTVTKKGFNEFLDTERLKLKKRDAESWSCYKAVGYQFASKHYLRSGLLLTRKIPQNKVIVNLVSLYEYYEETYFATKKTARQDDYGKLGEYGFMALQHMSKFMGECEILSETLCTSCNIDDVSGIVFVPDSNSENIYVMANFARFLRNLKKIDKNAVEFINLVKSNNYTHIPYEEVIILDKSKGTWNLSYDNVKNYTKRY